MKEQWSKYDRRTCRCGKELNPQEDDIFCKKCRETLEAIAKAEGGYTGS